MQEEMTMKDSEAEQYVKLAFRLMVVVLVIVTIAVAVEVFCAASVGMSISACLASLALGVLLGVGLDALRGRLWRR